MKVDNRKNNGGNKNAGRKPKSDEVAMIENMDATLAPISAWMALAAKVELGDTQAIKCWLEYRYGKPKQLIGIVTDTENIEQIFKINGVEIVL